MFWIFCFACLFFFLWGGRGRLTGHVWDLLFGVQKPGFQIRFGVVLGCLAFKIHGPQSDSALEMLDSALETKIGHVGIVLIEVMNQIFAIEPTPQMTKNIPPSGLFREPRWHVSKWMVKVKPINWDQRFVGSGGFESLSQFDQFDGAYSPENELTWNLRITHFEKEQHLPNHHFPGSLLIFQGFQNFPLCRFPFQKTLAIWECLFFR